MSQPRRKLFRRKALEHLSSPERLDQMMQIITLQAWLPLLTLSGLLGCGILWSIVGRIPITVQGPGILIQPRRVLKVQSPVDGQLQELKVKSGDCVDAAPPRGNPVNPASVVAVIDPSDLKQQRQLQKLRLAELQQQNQKSTNLTNQLNQLEAITRQQQQANLKQQLQTAQTQSPQILERSQVALQLEQSSLRKQLKDAQVLAPVFKERLDSRQQLFKSGALTRDAVLEADQSNRQNQQKIANYQAQLKQLEVSFTQTKQQYLDTLNHISKLKTQVQALHTQAKILEQETQNASNQRRNEISEVKRQIQQLDKQIKDKSTITSQYQGCILELLVHPGAVVTSGTELVSIKVDASDDKPTSIAFYSVADGKRIQPGMPIHVTPTTVSRERFGGIVGVVTSVSPLPISEQGGSILLGNPELTKSLMDKRPQLEIQAELKLDTTTASGYQWTSSRGPENLEITDGNTVQTWVTVEQRAPISFLLPILREWSGLQ